MAALDAPLVEAVVGDADEFYVDLQALEQAEDEMEMHATDIDTLIDRLMVDLSGLNLSGS